MEQIQTAPPPNETLPEYYERMDKLDALKAKEADAQYRELDWHQVERKTVDENYREVREFAIDAGVNLELPPNEAEVIAEHGFSGMQGEITIIDPNGNDRAFAIMTKGTGETRTTWLVGDSETRPQEVELKPGVSIANLNDVDGKMAGDVRLSPSGEVTVRLSESSHRIDVWADSNLEADKRKPQPKAEDPFDNGVYGFKAGA